MFLLSNPKSKSKHCQNSQMERARLANNFHSTKIWDNEWYLKNFQLELKLRTESNFAFSDALNRIECTQPLSRITKTELKKKLIFCIVHTHCLRCHVIAKETERCAFLCAYLWAVSWTSCSNTSAHQIQPTLPWMWKMRLVHFRFHCFLLHTHSTERTSQTEREHDG